MKSFKSFSQLPELIEQAQERLSVMEQDGIVAQVRDKQKREKDALKTKHDDEMDAAKEQEFKEKELERKRDREQKRIQREREQRLRSR